MKERYGILVNLDRCVGCYACEVACTQENNLIPGRRRLEVYELGPKEVDGKLRSEYLPIIAGDCTFCEHRIAEGLEPFCVQSCPVKALTFGNTNTILEKLSCHKRFQIVKLIESEKDQRLAS